jgi:hypothetical protein
VAQVNPALPAGYGVTADPGILTETFEGVPDGMNLALPAQELADTEAVYIQDALLDRPGLTRRRGPVQKVSSIGFKLSYPGTGLVMALNPLGVAKFAALNGNAGNGFFSVASDDLSTKTDLAWPHPLPTTPDSGAPYRIVDAKPALKGGLLVGVSSAYDSNAPNQGLAYWLGANKANYAAASITVAQGSSALTGTAFLANVAVGMWIFANTDEPYTNTLLGYVKSINSDTSITLSQPSPYSVSAKAATFQALRGIAPRVVTGRLTVDTTSTTVSGGATKFISQGLNTGVWQIYRASDMAFVGKVASVQSEIALTLAANAAVALADDAYIALRADADWSIPTTANTQKVGFLTTNYAGAQWYANNGSDFSKTSRLWFSDTDDPESLDLSTFDGNWFDISSSSSVNEPIRALVATLTGLIVLKETEAFIVTGNSPSTFTPKKLEDDGAISGMSVQSYGGGAIWAGREGIWFYDGIQVRSLTNDPTKPKLGDYWKNAVRSIDPNTYRMWSMINRDHYFLFVERAVPSVPVIKGTTSVTPNRLTVIVNLNTLAVTLGTNVNVRGAITLPASASKTAWYLVNGRMAGDAGDIGYIADGEALFNQEGVDPITCDVSLGGVAGPDFYFASKKFDGGDSTRLKKFKQLMLHYLVQGGSINVDTVIGLNDVGQLLSSSFSSSTYTWDTLRAAVSTWDALKGAYPTWDQIVQGVFIPKRVKFQRGSTHLGFRLYQSSNAIARLEIGPYHVGYKLLRPGRV